jgi:hypothetical protein
MSNEPAYYARTGTRPGDYKALLHPPYTAWHLSYVLLGAGLAPRISWGVLLLVLGAFFGGTGIAAHALDELNGRPLGTAFTDRQLKRIAAAGFALAFICAVWGAFLISGWVLVLAAVGALLVAAYSLEWWGGLIHTGTGFSLAWGAFPVLTSYWAQTEALSLAAVLAAGAAAWMSLAQRRLSTPARFVRRKTLSAEVSFETREEPEAWDRRALLDGWEGPLRALSYASIALGLALVLRHL